MLTTLFFRTFSILLLFTPSLGLFDCLHHGRLAARLVQNGHKIFDKPVNGVPITFYDAWEPFKIKDIKDFPGMGTSSVLAILILMCVFHFCVSTCIIKLISKHGFSARLLMQGFHTFIVPPIHFDWEFFYRQKMEGSNVVTCWKK